MKKMFISLLVVGAILMTGCAGGSIDFQNEINAVERHTIEFATGGGDISEFRKDIEDFNEKIDRVQSDNEKVIKFTQLQRKANEIRLEGFEDMDYDKINESTAYQAEALKLYNEIKDAN